MTLTFEGQSATAVPCREDEDIVTAAMRHGVLLLCDCRRGTCGTCRGFVEYGEDGVLLDHSLHALSEQDRDDGWILACRYCPRGPVHVDFDYAADRVAYLDPEARSGHIVDIDRRSHSVIRIVVRTLAAQAPLSWTPGQYVHLELVAAGLSRAFSMANVPDTRRELEFFVRRLRDGQFSNALWAMTGPGAVVKVRGPHGTFRLKEEGSPSLFIAGGTGVAPLLGMLQHLRNHDPGRRASLVLGIRREADLFVAQEFRSLADVFPRLDIGVTVEEPTNEWRGERGTAVEALQRRIARIPSPRGHVYYVCGPPPMVEEACRLLEQAGVDVANIRTERFTPHKEK